MVASCLAKTFHLDHQPLLSPQKKPLEGWQGQTGKYWTIEQGVIRGHNTLENAPKASTYLTTKKSYRNFRLVFEGKLVTSEMHSGVSLWGQLVEKENDPHS